MILIRVQEYTDRLLQGSMHRHFSKCSGDVRTFMQNGDARVAISHSVLTGGIIMFAPSSMAKSSSAMSVRSING